MRHGGFEPPTTWLKVKCSTTWASIPYSIVPFRKSLTKLSCLASYKVTNESQGILPLRGSLLVYLQGMNEETGNARIRVCFAKRACDIKESSHFVGPSLIYMPMWLNWQSSWFVISRLSVRVRSSAFVINRKNNHRYNCINCIWADSRVAKGDRL